MKIALLLLAVALPAAAAEAPKAAAAKADAPKAAAKAPAAAKATATPKDPYKTEDERTLYTIGFLVGRNLAPFEMNAAEVKVVQAGLADAALDKAPVVDVRFQQSKVNEMLSKRMEAGNAKRKEAGAAYVKKFLAEHKDKAVALPEGAYYLETQAGTGALPGRAATIKANYRGSLVDGKVFDASAPGTPTEFRLDGVVHCWTSAFQQIKVGGKGRIVCPSESAYGDRGFMGIKGGETLNFEVELVEIVKDEKEAPVAPAPAKKP